MRCIVWCVAMRSSELRLRVRARCKRSLFCDLCCEGSRRHIINALLLIIVQVITAFRREKKTHTHMNTNYLNDRGKKYPSCRQQKISNRHSHSLTHARQNVCGRETDRTQQQQQQKPLAHGSRFGHCTAVSVYHQQLCAVTLRCPVLGRPVFACRRRIKCCLRLHRLNATDWLVGWLWPS